MSSHRSELACPVASDIALDAVQQYLANLGYELRRRAATRLELFYRGSVLTSRFEKMRHDIAVTATGASVVFEFSTDWGLGTSDRDRESLDALALGAVHAATGSHVVARGDVRAESDRGR